MSFTYSIISLGQNDSTKVNKYTLCLYPFNTLVGDIALGCEHTGKRIKNEIIVSPKLFDFYSNKLFRGISGRYLFKYIFVKRERIHFSLDIGAFYRISQYFNKNNNWDKYITHKAFAPTSNVDPVFLMDEKIKSYGFSLGSSLLIYLNKKISLGLNLGVEYTIKEHKYNAKEFISGVVPYNLVTLPYIETKYSKYFYPYFLFKVCYEL